MIIECAEIFDDKLSDTVSLSKILDLMIIENSEVSVIIEFLRNYDEVFKEIISNSIYWIRLFQLDSILKCHRNDIDFIISKLKKLELMLKQLKKAIHQKLTILLKKK